MSISSDSEPPYNEFYDQRSLSDGEGSGVDFFGNERKSVGDKRGRKKAGQDRGHHGVNDTRAGLGGFFAPFQACCLGSAPIGPAGRYEPNAPNPARQSTPLAQFIMQTSHLSDSVSSGTSTDVDEVVLGAAPQVINTTRTRDRRRSTRRKEKESNIADLRQALRQQGLAWKDLAVTDALDAEAKWIVSATLQDALDTSWVTYTEDQKRFVALHWCRRIELSERISLRVLEKLMRTEDIPRDTNIPQALKRIDDLAVIEYVRLVEARLIEEVMGEFQAAANSATNTSSIYLIISSSRTVAISCRQQGEVLVINVFDTGMSQSRGPAFFGFDSASDTERFLIDLFTLDPRVRSSTDKYSAWTLCSKHAYQTLQPAVDKNIKDLSEKVKPVWDADADEARLNDPQYHAKLIYSEMYKATERPISENEPVFTHSAAGGIQVQEPKK